MTPEFARLIFTTFPPAMQTALRVAAQRGGWQAEDWLLHIEMIQDALLVGRAGYAEIAALYAAEGSAE